MMNRFMAGLMFSGVQTECFLHGSHQTYTDVGVQCLYFIYNNRVLYCRVAH